MARGSKSRRNPPNLDEMPTLSHTAMQRLRNGEYIHVAQAYLDSGDGETAASLVRDLKPWARRRVLGR